MGMELQAAAIFNSWVKASGNIAFSRNKIRNLTEYIDDYDNGGQVINPAARAFFRAERMRPMTRRLRRRRFWIWRVLFSADL